MWRNYNAVPTILNSAKRLTRFYCITWLNSLTQLYFPVQKNSSPESLLIYTESHSYYCPSCPTPAFAHRWQEHPSRFGIIFFWDEWKNFAARLESRFRLQREGPKAVVSVSRGEAVVHLTGKLLHITVNKLISTVVLGCKPRASCTLNTCFSWAVSAVH